MTPKTLQQELFPTTQNPQTLRACEIALDALNLPQKSTVRSFEVAQLLVQLKLDEKTLMATLLSDANLEERYPLAELKQTFDDKILSLTEGIRRLNEFKRFNPETIDNEIQRERLRQMLLAMTHDIRIMIVKLAYRVVRLRYLKYEDKETQQNIAYETELIFAPLANRLGIAQLKWELEDLSFRFLYPTAYKEIAQQLQAKRTQREAYIESVIQHLKMLTEQHQIPCKITGRPKHIYSIWRKMQKKHLPIDELYDLRAVRIYVEDVQTCYEVLGLIHQQWNYIKDEFDDYIATPKENGYQSIHTVIIGPQGKTVEIQIRTYEMHQHAEFGVAAHWKYKEGQGHFDQNLERSIATVRQLLDNIDDPEVFNEISTELTSENIYVLTPDADIITLRQGATPLDFAYHIHTELGHRCIGAKVNGRIVPLTIPLQTGDRVEVLTAKTGHPSRNWLNPNLGYLKTASARNKVRQWFNKHHREHNIEAGKEVLKKELKRLHAQHLKAEELAQRFRVKDTQQLYEFIGKGQINERQINDAIQRLIQTKAPQAQQSFFASPEQPADQAYVVGAPQLKTQLAPCCQPQVGDPIIGYVTRGRGITIHQQQCPNILHLTEAEQKRLIEVAWASENTPTTSPRLFAELELRLVDLSTQTTALMKLLAEHQIDILQMQRHTTPTEGEVLLQLQISVPETLEIGTLLDHIEQQPHILDVTWRQTASTTDAQIHK